MISIFFWIIVSVLAYFITTAVEFICVAGLVGMTMGGIQALSRSTYAKIIPDDTTDHASYFSFYDVSIYSASLPKTAGLKFSVAPIG